MSTPLSRPKALIFDLDGTLVDTVGTRVTAWLDVFRAEGIDADPADLAPLMGSDGKLLARTVAARAGLTLDDVRAAEIDDRAGLRFGELNREPGPLPGVTELVAFLDANGIDWAVATSSQPGQVQASIDALGLDGRPRVTDGSAVEHAKPAPDLLLSSAEQLEIAPAAIWYVGDARWDMLAASAAGMTAVAVTTGATGASELREAGADVVVDDLTGVLRELRAVVGASAER